ncbi:DUF3043 domain-containing protein [Bifidobacterium choloepi]|uniref:DUF3043 domain-containing protein n=1 Tax=Bifidobacterium choloepi TaxID=2614131 RepID=A0A6I5NFU9_9BIFI|nr:DUF3043 domain-containing protein [Bifidobacterium choloepi]NEG70224.1 DUF3043 domain-containing protein [Bifidobacterium choloepi]
MALNKKEEQEQAAVKGGGTAKATQAPSPAPTPGKGKPTPKRKEAQAKNLRPLVPQDTKAERKRAKERIRERENVEYEAMRTGNVSKMPKAERLPWRVYIRDYVDARFNIGEYFIPVAIVILLLSILVSFLAPGAAYLSLILMIVMYVYLFVIIIDVAVMWHRLKKRLAERYGESSVARGSRSGTYAWSRAIQLRRWRLPKPKYKKRSQYPADVRGK